MTLRAFCSFIATTARLKVDDFMQLGLLASFKKNGGTHLPPDFAKSTEEQRMNISFFDRTHRELEDADAQKLNSKM